MVAYEPHLAAIVLSGAGGDLRLSLRNKRNPVDIASLIPVVLQDSDGGPALDMLKAYFERSDAVNYGGLMLYNLPTGVMLRPLVQTYGLGDTYSPNATMQALAGSIGLPVVGPVVAGSVGVDGRTPRVHCYRRPTIS